MPEKKCTGDCLRCSFQQQVYCAAQHGHAIMSFIPNMLDKLSKIESALAQFGKEDIINPLKTEEVQQSPGAAE